jgi:hypothetical protein
LDTWLLKTWKQRMILKVWKVWKLVKEHKLWLLCCQRMVWSFIKTIYSESVFHLILLSLRCTKGVYPCWETLGVKSLSFGEIIIRKHYFFIKTSNQRLILIVNDILLCICMRLIHNVFFSSPQTKNTSYEHHVPIRMVWPPIIFLW